MGNSDNQLLLDLALRPALGRDDFFVSATNEQAVSAIDKWPDWPNRVQILSGPPGSGKSHLAEVWCRASGATKTSIDQIAIEKLPGVFSKGALVIEDLPGAALDETTLFHLINLTREQGAYLLLTSVRSPAEWNVQLPDLASRLAAAGSAILNEPDDVLLRAILIKQFSDRQIKVDEALISYMLSRMERSARAARDLVATIDKQAMHAKANVTRRFVATIMN